MVRLRTGADTDPEATLEALRQRRDLSAAKLERYVTIREEMLSGRTPAQFAASARHVGPYLTVNAGISLERSHLTWLDETIAFLEARQCVVRQRSPRLDRHSHR